MSKGDLSFARVILAAADPRIGVILGILILGPLKGGGVINHGFTLGFIQRLLRGRSLNTS